MNDDWPHGPDDEDVAGARHDLARMLERRGVDLDDAALWREPAADLEERIMASIGEAARIPAIPTRRPRAWWVAAAAAAAVVVAVAVVALLQNRGPEPNWAIDLLATEAAPTASATVYGWNAEGGTRLLVEVAGLEPAPAGYMYEVWFSNRDRHISAGTFAAGDAFDMWVGVRRADFPRIWITLEPLDADPAPGLTVLDVEV